MRLINPQQPVHLIAKRNTSSFSMPADGEVVVDHNNDYHENPIALQRLRELADDDEDDSDPNNNHIQPTINGTSTGRRASRTATLHAYEEESWL